MNRIELPLTPLLERPLKSKKKQQRQAQQATLTAAVSLTISSQISSTSTHDTTATSSVSTAIVSSSTSTSTTVTVAKSEQPLHSLAFDQMLSREQLIMNAFPLELSEEEAKQYASVASACACVNYINTSSSTSPQVILLHLHCN